MGKCQSLVDSTNENLWLRPPGLETSYLRRGLEVARTVTPLMMSDHPKIRSDADAEILWSAWHCLALAWTFFRLVTGEVGSRHRPLNQESQQPQAGGLIQQKATFDSFALLERKSVEI